VRLGRALQENGFFNGQGATKVLLVKAADGFRIFYILQKGRWDDPEVLDWFRDLRAHLAEKVFPGKPVEICLCDRALVPQRTLN
jgi:hypothetical protein